MTYTHEMVTVFVTERFIASEQGSTVKDIAEGLNISQTTVRKILVDSAGCPDGLSVSRESRPSYSKNYPGVVSNHHLVDVYYPSRSRLARRIREFRSSF